MDLNSHILLRGRCVEMFQEQHKLSFSEGRYDYNEQHEYDIESS